MSEQGGNGRYEDMSAEELNAAVHAHRRRFGGSKLNEMWRNVFVLGRMARAHQRGEYRLVTPQILALMSGLAYVVTPVDAVPEAVLGPAGLVDDAGVVTWVVSAMAYEIGCFLQWEKEQQRLAS